MTMRCHSVRSTRLPRSSFQLSLVAMTSVTTVLPVLGRAHLGVAAEVADQLHAVEIAGHLQFLPLSILSGRSPAPRRRRSLGCGRRRPGSGPPAPERRDWRGSAATRERASRRRPGLDPGRGCGSGTETGLDRECPREPEDDGEERKLYSLETVRGFHRFDFSSLAAVAFFSVFLEPLRNGGRARGPA